MTFKWLQAAFPHIEFQPRSVCNFGEGDGDSGPGGGGDFSGGDTFGDPSTGSTDFGPDTSGGPSFSGDTSGPDTSGPSFSGDTSGPSVTGDTSGGPSFTGDTSGPAISGDSFFGGPAISGDTWGQTSGVDFTGGANPFGGPMSGNTGLNNAVGPPGWATGDFGTYGTGGPTGTGQGPGAGPSIGGPNAYTSAPGITGFAGDLGAPPGGALGMQQDAGPQTGPGQLSGQEQMIGGQELSDQGRAGQNSWLGGPETVQPGESRGFFAPDPTSTTIPTDDRGQNFFGDPTSQQQNAGNFFGIGQAQAATRGSDQSIIDAANQLAQAQQAIYGQNLMGGNMTPGAQYGFTGVSPAQASGGPFGLSGQFTGQASAFGPDSSQGKGDRGATEPTNQAYPGAEQNTARSDPSNFNISPVTPGDFPAVAQSQQQAPTQDDFSSRFDAVQSPNQSVQSAFEALDGRGTPQQTINAAFDAINAMQQQQSMQQAQPFDQQAQGEQGRSGRPGDTFDSRFGDPNQFAPTQTETRGTDPNQAPPWDEGERGPVESTMETISRSPNEDTISNMLPASPNVGREAAPLGLMSMIDALGRPGGSLGGNPSQAGGRASSGPFGTSQTGGRSSDTGRPGLSITVGGRTSDPGYYNTGGRGIAPGARGAEVGGIYGPGAATGRPGSNTFGVSSREGAFGFYDPSTGLYYGGRR